MTQERYISLRHITKKFKNITAVDDFSLTVNQGDIYGFLGPNGAGKSTCIRMMLGLVKPTSGDIDMFGYDIRTHRKEVLANIGALIERPDFYDYLSAQKNLQILGQLSGVNDLNRKTDEVLDLVGLRGRRYSKVKTFSQGMKQRLGIAQSLLHDPKLIILDEPANGLDPQGQHEMRKLIKTINEEKGITILISSHILQEIEQTANRMVIINQGKSVVEGTVAELLEQGAMLVTYETNNPDKAAKIIRETKWNSNLKTVESHSIQMELEKEDVAEVTQRFVQNGLRLYGVKPVRSLENYFLKITGHA
jgi:ABC-2 type transport system ATP-binding protein